MAPRPVGLVFALLLFVSLTDHTSGQCNVPLDVVIAMDTSFNVGSVEFPNLKVFASTLASSLANSETKFAVVSFSATPVNYNFLADTQPPQVIQTTIVDVPYVGAAANTHMALASLQNHFSVLNGDRPQYQNVAFVLTNGKSTQPDATRAMAAGLAVSANVIVVGFGPNINENDLKDISSDPDVLNQNYFLYGANTISDIVAMLCEDTTTTTTTTTTPTTPTTTASPTPTKISLPSMTPPTTIPDSCDYWGCVNGGTCYYGRCHCINGFTGEFCQIYGGPPPCGGWTCRNGGSCYQGVCHCPSGYQGTYCEEKIDVSCYTVGCENDGECINGECHCTEGYWGQYCEEGSRSICREKPYICQNYGICRDIANEYYCDCPKNYRGWHCEEEVNKPEKRSPEPQEGAKGWHIILIVVAVIVICSIICFIVMKFYCRKGFCAKSSHVKSCATVVQVDNVPHCHPVHVHGPSVGCPVHVGRKSHAGGHLNHALIYQ